MEFCHDFIEQLTSEDEFTVLDSILHIKDVLLENIHIEISLKNKELLEVRKLVCFAYIPILKLISLRI